MSTLEEPMKTAASALESAADSFAKASTARRLPPAPPATVAPVNFADPKNAVQAARAILGHEPEPEHVDAVINTAQVLAAGAEAAGGSAGFVPAAIPPISLQASGPNFLPVRERSRMATWMFWLAGLSAVGAVVIELAGGASGDRPAFSLIILAMISTVAAYLTTMGFGSFKLNAGEQQGGDGEGGSTQNGKS